MTDHDREFYTTTEVADMFRVDAQTVTRWAARGLLPHLRTPGGQHRYPKEKILELLRFPDDNNSKFNSNNSE